MLLFSRLICLETVLPFQRNNGDYFQAMRNIIAPAEAMVRQQSSLIITLEWEYS